MTRHHYTVDLNDWVDDEPLNDLELHSLTPDDAETLAVLMLDAYRGTIDFEGDATIDDARQEVDRYLGMESADLSNSRLALIGDQVASACLVNSYTTHSFIGYVMTDPRHKGQGVGTATLRASLRSLAATGHSDVGAFITEGNAPSEAMFSTVGAIRRPTHVYHIAVSTEWEARTDTYAPSTFIEEGFTHCSTADQLEQVARGFYAGRSDLTLLTIPAVEAGSSLVYEDLYGAGEPFPHIYMLLPVEAVSEAAPYSVP